MILIEFQSSIDRFMVLPVLHYIVSFYMRLRDSEEEFEKLPPVFPIVVYSSKELWTAPVNLAELIENNELLGEFALNFNYFKIAENEISIEKLLEKGLPILISFPDLKITQINNKSYEFGDGVMIYTERIVLNSKDTNQFEY